MNERKMVSMQLDPTLIHTIRCLAVADGRKMYSLIDELLRIGLAVKAQKLQPGDGIVLS